jgi:hypothetical protein
VEILNRAKRENISVEGDVRASSGAARRMAMAMAVLIFVSLSFVASAVPQNGVPSVRAMEYQIKAAFLFNFAKFVDWPTEGHQSGDGLLTFCTLGEDPFHGALDER